jgi:hypothetical protein
VVWHRRVEKRVGQREREKRERARHGEETVDEK